MTLGNTEIKKLDIDKNHISLRWEPNKHQVQIINTEDKAELHSSDVTANCSNCSKTTTLRQALTQHKNKETRVYYDRNPGLSKDVQKGLIHWNKIDSKNKTYCSKECKLAEEL